MKKYYYLCLVLSLSWGDGLMAKEVLVIKETTTVNPFKGAPQVLPVTPKNQEISYRAETEDEVVQVDVQDSPSETSLKRTLATPDSTDVETEELLLKKENASLSQDQEEEEESDGEDEDDEDDPDEVDESGSLEEDDSDDEE